MIGEPSWRALPPLGWDGAVFVSAFSLVWFIVNARVKACG